VVKRGKLSMDTSIVVVWRKGSEGVVEASQLYGEMVESAASRAKELMDLGVTGRDLVIGTLAAALATATRYREVRVMGRLDTKTLVDKYVYPATYLGLARAMARRADLKDGVRSPDAMFYLLVKSTLAGAKKKVLESTDLRLFSIGTSLDVNLAIKSWKILRASGEEGEEGGAKVAKAKTLVLVEPPSAEPSKLAELLEARGVGYMNPNMRCVVDALHYTEYLAVTCSRQEFRRRLDELKASYPSFVEEALSLAKILAKVLPEEDVEKKLCEKIVEHLSPVEEKLSEYTG
jgi:putative DNA methylase